MPDPGAQVLGGTTAHSRVICIPNFVSNYPCTKLLKAVKLSFLNSAKGRHFLLINLTLKAVIKLALKIVPKLSKRLPASQRAAFQCRHQQDRQKCGPIYRMFHILGELLQMRSRLTWVAFHLKNSLARVCTSRCKKMHKELV